MQNIYSFILGNIVAKPQKHEIFNIIQCRKIPSDDFQIRVFEFS